MKIAGLLALAIFSPVFSFAAELININTADVALLDTLPGIGPTYAARIVDYRVANGPFARIEDIQNVSGIGPSTYENIAPLITVGAASAPVAPIQAAVLPTVSPTESASTPAPPTALSIRVDGDEDALVGVPLRLITRVTSKGGALVSPAQISWSFGDGSSATGNVAEKLYRYAGTYPIVVTVTDGAVSARDELIVTVTSARVHLFPVTGDGITIANDSSERLDLSGWRLLVDSSSFRIPEGMTVLPNASALLPYSITHLPMSSDVALAYPDGTVAVRTMPIAHAAPAAEKPSGRVESLETVQAVEPIISARANIQENEEAVGAPAVATELVTAGAALSAESPEPSRTLRLFKSPWTLSFIGLMALAGGAFILL